MSSKVENKRKENCCGKIRLPNDDVSLSTFIIAQTAKFPAIYDIKRQKLSLSSHSLS